MKVIIPLCGKGSRFHPNVKSLVKVFTKPILQQVVDCLPCRPIIIVNDRTYNKDFEEYGEIINIHEETQGAAETIYKGLLAMNIQDSTEGLLFLDGDTFYREDIVKLIQENPTRNQVIVFRDTQPIPFYSYVKTDDTNKIFMIREKEKISNLANTGAYYFSNSKDLLEACKEVLDKKLFFHSEPYISAVINVMLQKNIEWFSKEISSSKYFSLGTPEQVKEYINNSFLYLFDLDGTLVETDKVYYKVWEQILKDFNITLTQSIYDTYIFSNSDSNVKKTLLRSCPITLEDLSKKKDEYFLQYSNNLIKTVEGSEKFIQSIYEKGYPIAVVTNCNRLVAEHLIKLCNLDKYVYQIIVGNECSRAKPYPDPYEKALEIFGVPSNRSFIFEDSSNGVLSAKGVSPKCLVGISSNPIGSDILFPNFTNINHNILESFQTDKVNDFKSWIRKSIEKKYQSIQSIEISPMTLKGGFIADVYDIKVCIENKEHKMIFKVENKNESQLNQIAHNLDLYNREYYFYESISQHIPIKIPYFYGIVKDDSFNTVGVLLENLNKKHFHLNLNLNVEKIEVSFSVIEQLAKLHSSCWGKELDKSFSLLKKNNHSCFQPHWSNFIKERSISFMEKWSSCMTEKQIDFFKITIESFDQIQNSLSKEPLTLVHGDVKSPNIFFNKTNDKVIPYFIDWQYIVYGKGVQDLVFFMIESFSEDICEKYHKIFIEYYYIKLIEYGVKEYSYTQYMSDLQKAVAYFPFFVAIWFGTTKVEDLIDVNFPYFYIMRYLNYINLVCKE
jgi:beta-phosphoglucomutase-like phosphatase (HAD superfamily)/choline kinase